MSVKIHRVLVPSARVPSCRMSWPFQRPTCSSRCARTGLVHAMRQARIDASHDRSVVPYMFIAGSKADAPVLAPRHDPDVLDGAPLEHPGCVNLTGQAAVGDADPVVMHHREIPAAAQPAVDVVLLRNLLCARRGRELGKEAGQFPNCCRHDG